MSVNLNVTTDMVSSLIIDGVCYESASCSHDCRISLQDGRVKCIPSLVSSYIYPLVCSISKDKIKTDYSDWHFDNPFNNESIKSANEILTELFANTVKN